MSILEGLFYAALALILLILICRKTGIIGTVVGYVPGHGGDVWFVQHDESDEVGAYCFTELEPYNAKGKRRRFLPSV